MAEAYVLVDAVPDALEETAAWLRSLPEVRAVHEVRYGHFRFLAEVEGRTHAELQAFLVTKVARHKGVEQVREVGEGDVPAILASEETPV